MGLGIGGQQAGGVDLGVFLGGGQAGVAQQLLDGAQVGPGPQQVGGEAVAQGVGRGRGGQAEAAAQALDRGLNLTGTERAAASGAEQGLIRLKDEGP